MNDLGTVNCKMPFDFYALAAAS